MAYVDKKSLRKEFEKLKEEFIQISRTSKVPVELSIVFKSLLVLFEVMITVFLEKKVRKNNSNSHIPSSQTKKDETSPSIVGTNGNGNQENGSLSSNTQTSETFKTSKVDFCESCGENLKKQEAEATERRTKIDIIFKKIIIHVDAEIKTCPSCDEKNKGKFPSDFQGPIQYDGGVKSFVISLLIGQMISLNRIKKMIKTLIEMAISEETILKYVYNLHFSLERWECNRMEDLLKMRAINCDETSLRVDKKNYWIHSYSSGDITLKFLHKNRGKEAIEDIGIIPMYGGTIIHDCWSPYLFYDYCEHGLCGSHLLRELQFIIDSNSFNWAKKMKKFLIKLLKKVAKRKLKRLSKTEYEKIMILYRNIVKGGEIEMPSVPTKNNGRGRIAKSNADNLLERFKNYEDAVLAFSRVTEVSFTNNRAERDLRMSKVKQKVSGCFRKVIFAEAYCRISSYLQTMSNKGYNPLIAIQMALTGSIPN